MCGAAGTRRRPPPPATPNQGLKIVKAIKYISIASRVQSRPLLRDLAEDVGVKNGDSDRRAAETTLSPREPLGPVPLAKADDDAR